MKNIIAIALFLLSLTTFAQKETIPPPSSADALNRLKTDAALHKMIKERTGYDYAKLKLVKTYDWAKFYTEEGELRSNRWVKDAISMAYDMETPKDKDGAYSQYQVFVDYRRSECNMNGCLMTDSYKFYKYGVGPEYKMGFKEFNDVEKMNLLTDYLKNNKPQGLHDFVTIDNLEVRKGYVQQDISPTQQIINYNISGKIGIYSGDRTFLLKTVDVELDPSRNYVSLYVSKKGGNWKADSLQFGDYYDREYVWRDYNFESISKEYLQSFKDAGFDGVYKKISKIEQPKGMYSQLPERITEFYNMVVAKGELITVEDIMPFVPKQSLSRDSEEETKANIKSKLDFSAERVEVDLLTKFNLDMNRTILGYDRCGENKCHSAFVYINGTKSTYKASKGKAKKNKAIKVDETRITSKWIYDIELKKWFLVVNGDFLNRF